MRCERKTRAALGRGPRFFMLALRGAELALSEWMKLRELAPQQEGLGERASSPKSQPRRIFSLAPGLPRGLCVLILVGCSLESTVPGGTTGRVRSLDSACAGITSLEGTVLAPAQLVSNGAATLVANNASSLVSKNSSGYRVQAIATVPLAGAQVDLIDGAGSMVGQTQSNDSGSYSYACLPSNTAYLIQAHFAIPGASFVEQTIGRTPPASQAGANTGAQVASVTPATTLAAAKLLTTAGTASSGGETSGCVGC